MTAVGGLGRRVGRVVLLACVCESQMLVANFSAIGCASVLLAWLGIMKLECVRGVGVI